MSHDRKLHAGEYMSVNRLIQMLTEMVAEDPAIGECEVCYDGVPSSFHHIQVFGPAADDQPVDPVVDTVYLVGSW